MTTLRLHGIAGGLVVALMCGDSLAHPAVAQANLCALLTEAEAEAIVGKPLAAPERQAGGDCWYPERAGAGGGGEIMLHIYPYRFDSKENFHAFLVTEVKAADENMKEAVTAAGGTFKETVVEPVPELKDPAYYADPTLFVLKGGKVLGIVAPRPQAVAVAGKAVPRLE
ncbi:MAG: hypothetical protein ACJ8DC_20490 [Gemmatimonadales bacterium]